MVSKSDMGFQTRTWGVETWILLHLISLNYPVKPTAADKRKYKQFFLSIGHVLPCAACRKSYDEIISEGALKLSSLSVFASRNTLSRWVFDLHNEVSRRIGGKIEKDFNAMCRRYEKCRASKCAGHKCDVPDARKKKRSVVLLIDEDAYLSCKSLRELVCKTKTQSIKPFMDISK